MTPKLSHQKMITMQDEINSRLAQFDAEARMGRLASMDAISRFPEILRSATIYQDDAEVVLGAVKTDVSSIEFASERLRQIAGNNPVDNLTHYIESTREIALIEEELDSTEPDNSVHSPTKFKI